MKIPLRNNDFLERVRIVAIYALFGSLWIYLSDNLVGWLIDDPAIITRLSVYKGILFIVLTSALLYFLVARYLSRMAEFNHQLAKSEDRFISILNNISDAIFIHDAVTGAIVDANESVSRMFGYDREEIVRLLVGDISQGEPPYSQAKALQWLSRAADGVSPVTFEWCCRRKDASLFWVDCTMRKALVGDEEFIIVSVRDISERKRMETSLRESEQQFRTLTENSPNIIMRYDRECRRVYVNPSYSRATGIFVDEAVNGALGNGWLDSMSMVTRDYMSRLRQVMECGVPAEMLLEWKSRETGRVTSHILNVVAEKDSDGRICGCLAIGHDISGLREAEFRLARLAETSPGVMFTFLLKPDGTSRMPYISSRATEYGLSPEVMAEDVSEAFALIHPDDRARVQKSVSESARTLSPWHGEFRLRHPTKGDVWVEGRGTPEIHPDCCIIWSGFFHDITERKLTEKSLRAKQEQLASMAIDLSLAEDRERRRIASELHDHIGQLLLLSKIKLDSLAGAFINANNQKTYNEIHDHIAQTIRDVRSLTQQLNPPLLASVGLEAALEWLAQKMEVDYSLQVDFADDGNKKPLNEEIRAILFQSARELLINVAKHAKIGKARLAIGRDADMIMLMIADQGVGFDCPPNPDINITLNSSFGLFNIRQRIKHIGGVMMIESEPGCGTCVRIHVPFTDI